MSVPLSSTKNPQRCCEAATVGCRQFPQRVGILVAQLGTPDAPTPRALRRYLRQFLSDPRVIEVPRLLWWFILHCIILVTRPRRSAALYRRMWQPEGSPLLRISQRQTEALKQQLASRGFDVSVKLGMRYGSPSIESALDSLIDEGCSRIAILPMYPQYAAATTASTYDAVFPHLLKRRYVPTVHVIEPYFRNAHYLSSLATSINQFIADIPDSQRPEKLLLSYHGIPQAYVQKGDPYCCMCSETSKRLIPLLNFPAEDVIHCFQSRFGKAPWLQPYTDETLIKLGKEGIKRIAICAPGFTADCLETLDELGNEGKHQFTEHGGEIYHFIPCLNDSPHWIENLASIVHSELSAWHSEESALQDLQISCPHFNATGVDCSKPTLKKCC